MKKWQFIMILLVVLSKIVKISSTQNISIKITDGNTPISSLNVVLYDKYIPKSTEIKLDITAKICYLPDFEQLKFILEKYQNLYNNRWIFMIEDFMIWKKMENYLISYNPGTFFAFIWSKKIADTDFYNNYYPVFISEIETFEVLKGFNIENESGNYFVNVKYDNFPTQYPNSYLSILSITCAAYSLIIVMIWQYVNFKIYRNYITSLQKALTSLPYIKFLLSLLVVYYVSVSLDHEKDNFSILIKVYSETIISALTSISKTIYWFIIIMVSWGWQIYRFTLTRIEMRIFIGVYVFIYISVCFDQIIDLMIDYKIWNFECSELKNFIIYTIFSGGSFYLTRKSLNFLKTKSVYAIVLAPEYLPALILKMKMLYLHIIVVISFTILYISTILTQKFLFPQYSNIILSLVNNQFIELIAMTFYLLIFRARKFPSYFNIDYYSEEINNNGKIYSINIPQINSLLSVGSFNDFGLVSQSQIPKKRDMKDDFESPFIIINPIFQDNSAINNSNNGVNRSESLNSANINSSHCSVIDKLSISFRKKI